MSKLDKVKFSIIVPTYNEEDDIPKTLNALSDLKFDNYEVIVVDDKSEDNTVDKVSEFVNKFSNFKLLQNKKNKGVSFSRNRGIKEAEGNVLVILNADVILPPNFLNKLEPYYEEGYEWVGVSSKVMNADSIYSRYTGAKADYIHDIKGDYWVWSEGFSCTKEAALSVGMFPEDMPACSGEDKDFGYDLEENFKGIRAKEIEAPHIAPSSFKGFWGQNKSRGGGRTNYYYYLDGKNKFNLFLSTFLSSCWRVLKMFLFVPFFNAWMSSGYSKKDRSDFLNFIWASYIKQIAMLTGMWSAFLKILKNNEN